MKVKIKDLQPNPFRDLENYPFNLDKIEQLKKSIKQTGFWDNVIARQVDGAIQIAYGHHRLRALQEVYDGNFEIEVPIKPLSDELMLIIMANENMEEWGSSIAITDNTVKSVRDNFGKIRKYDGHVSSKEIHEFLGTDNWKLHTIENSFRRIRAIEKGSVDKVAVESIQSDTAATVFTTAIKGKGLTTGQQRRVANRIEESKNYSPQSVRLAVEKEAAPEPTRKDVENKQQRQLIIDFDDYLSNVTDIASKLKDEVQKMRGMKSQIRDYQPDQFENRLMLKLSLEGLQKSIINTLKELDND